MHGFSLSGLCGLHILAREGGRDVIPLFIEFVEAVGPDRVDHRDGAGCTLLHAVCERAKWGVGPVRHLVQLGAQVNAVDSNGRSPLHVIMHAMSQAPSVVRP
jgi:hypothetical protein